MLLGCIADDLTGASDLALTLSREGMRTVQLIGLPEGNDAFGKADAVVVSLKSRTIPAGDAVEQSLAAGRALLAAGAHQLFFKYCSTFDSTDEGNIGPVADALLDLVDEKTALACPAFPTNKRTVYQGYLFVGNRLLSESPMAHHPLTPMRDPDLVRVLGRQSRLAVGLIEHATVRAGHEAVAETISKTQGLLIADAITDEDLRTLGRAAENMRLITGGSGIALGLPENFRRQGLLSSVAGDETFRIPEGRAVILAGSCSAATRGQVAVAIEAGTPALKLDPFEIAEKRLTPEDVARFVTEQTSSLPPLVYSSDEPDAVEAVQQRLGRAEAGTLVEDLLSRTAILLAAQGFTRFVVAGGETSGAVVNALGVKGLQIGPEIDPGVPWTLSIDSGRPLALALKSGNFGAPDFFLKSLEQKP